MWPHPWCMRQELSPGLSPECFASLGKSFKSTTGTKLQIFLNFCEQYINSISTLILYVNILGASVFFCWTTLNDPIQYSFAFPWRFYMLTYVCIEFSHDHNDLVWVLMLSPLIQLPSNHLDTKSLDWVSLCLGDNVWVKCKELISIYTFMNSQYVVVMF